MKRRDLTIAFLFVMGSGVHVGAQTGDASHPCSLLTTAQVTAAVGAVGASAEGDMPGTGRGANPLRRACSWGLPGGTFVLSVGKAPNTSLDTRGLLDYINKMYDLLKGKGWKYDKKDFGSTSCSLVTPPSGDANSSPATSCATVTKGMLVMTSASSKPSIPMEKLKSLVETAAGRLR